jgi:hypothetical protein
VARGRRRRPAFHAAKVASHSWWRSSSLGPRWSVLPRPTQLPSLQAEGCP